MSTEAHKLAGIGMRLGAVVLLSSGAPAEAKASPFLWPTCDVSSPQNIPYSYDTADELRRNQYCDSTGTFGYAAPPGDPCPHYGMGVQDLTYRIHANPYVRFVSFRIARFETRYAHDYLSIGQATETSDAPILNSYRWTDEVSGYFAPSTEFSLYREQTPHTVKGFHQYPAILRFNAEPNIHANYDDPEELITDEGIYIDRAAVTCGSFAPYAAPYIWPGSRHQFLSLGVGDTFYFAVQGRGTGSFPPPDDEKRAYVAIWPNEIAPGDRFDIYARCNSFPDHDNYDFTTNTSTEAVKQGLLLYNEVCPEPGTWYVAVHQETGGPSSVNIAMTEGLVTKEITVRAGFNFQSTLTERTRIGDILNHAARFFYGATEGSLVIRNVTVYDTTDCGDCDGNGAGCTICFVESQNACCSCGCVGSCTGGIAQIGQCGWQDENGNFYSLEGGARLVAHEWGHQYLSLPDEYITSSISGCNHSIMAHQWKTNNLCTSFDHMTECEWVGMPWTCNTPLPSGAAWNNVQSFLQVDPKIQTPDYYNYLNHPLPTVGHTRVAGSGSSCSSSIGALPSTRDLLLWFIALAICVLQLRKRNPQGAQGGVES